MPLVSLDTTILEGRKQALAAQSSQISTSSRAEVERLRGHWPSSIRTKLDCAARSPSIANSWPPCGPWSARGPLLASSYSTTKKRKLI